VNLVVDTSVWSLVLRRPRVDEDDPPVRAFRWHLESGDGMFMVGNILQELLDGLRSTKQFDRLLALLDPYPLRTYRPMLPPLVYSPYVALRESMPAPSIS